MIPVAVVGCGRVVLEAYVPVIRNLTAIGVVGIHDVIGPNAADLADALGLSSSSVLESIDDVLNGPAEVVLVAVPPRLAPPLVVQFLKAEKDVIVEKPLSLDVRALEQVELLAGETGRGVVVVENYAYRSDLRAAIEWAWVLGEPRFVRLASMADGAWQGTERFEPEWRTDPLFAAGGALADKGYHLLCLAEALAESELVQLEGLCLRVRPGLRVEDTAVLIGTHASGTVSAMEVSWAVRGGATDVIEAHGPGGSVYVDANMRRPVTMVTQEGERTLRQAGPPDPWGYRGFFKTAFARLRDKDSSTRKLGRERRLAALISSVYAGWDAGR